MDKIHSSFTPPFLISGLPENTPVLAAFSGGADSSALLFMLAEYGKRTGAKIYAAHVNHMIRGEEADRDEEFCRRVAKSLGIEIFVLRRDVPAYAKECGKSVETAARDVRYEFFDSIMKENGIPLLATAHNANDNMETVIFNMVRGCGLKGACGIPESRPCGGGTVVRPILGMSRREILAYCEENSIEFVTDSTNVDTDYTRNMIRAKVIPALEGINENAIENVWRLTQSLKSDALCLDSLTNSFLGDVGEDISLECEKLLSAPDAVASRAIIALFSKASDGESLEAEHVRSILQLCRTATPHSRLNLPREIDAKIENGKLYFEKRKERPTPAEDFEIKLCEEINSISEVNAQIIIGNSQKPINIYKKSILLYFDSDKIFGELTARNRRAGDKILVRGMNRSVKKLLCDKKIPLDIRYRLPVICDAHGIVAVPLCAERDGVSLAKVKDKTRALCVRIDLL